MSVREHENPFAKFKKTEVEEWLTSPITEAVREHLRLGHVGLEHERAVLCGRASELDPNAVQRTAIRLGAKSDALSEFELLFVLAYNRLSLDEVPHG